MTHLRDYCQATAAADESPRRRGDDHQNVERTLEQAARGHAIELSAGLNAAGWRWHEVANLLDLSPRTLRDWRRGLSAGATRPSPLGRPVICSPREKRDEVLELIDEYGPAVGVPALREAFPAMLRAELADLLAGYRRDWRARHFTPLRVLHWHRVGAVWAIDFTGPGLPLADGAPYLLAARDLASGRQLLWRPCTEATASTVTAALTMLFAAHGAPLVLKCDNGSPFIAGVVRDLAREAGVGLLYSPPGMPRYNGAIEAGIGSLKTRTDRHATRHGHAGVWVTDDLEAARLEANELARSPREPDLTPDEAWAERAKLTPEERTLFREEVRRQRTAIDAQGGPHANPTTEQYDRARDRQAIRRALEGHGLLSYTRRRIPLPIHTKKAAIIP